MRLGKKAQVPSAADQALTAQNHARVERLLESGFLTPSEANALRWRVTNWVTEGILGTRVVAWPRKVRWLVDEYSHLERAVDDGRIIGTKISDDQPDEAAIIKASLADPKAYQHTSVEGTLESLDELARFFMLNHEYIEAFSERFGRQLLSLLGLPSDNPVLGQQMTQAILTSPEYQPSQGDYKTMRAAIIEQGNHYGFERQALRYLSNAGMVYIHMANTPLTIKITRGTSFTFGWKQTSAEDTPEDQPQDLQSLFSREEVATLREQGYSFLNDAFVVLVTALRNLELNKERLIDVPNWRKKIMESTPETIRSINMSMIRQTNQRKEQTAE